MDQGGAGTAGGGSSLNHSDLLFAITSVVNINVPPPIIQESNDQKQPADIPSINGSVSLNRFRKNLV